MSAQAQQAPLAPPRQPRSSQGTMRAFTVVLFAIFVVVDLLAIMAGTRGYQALHQAQATQEARDLSLGPIVSAVRANDASSAIGRGQGPEGESLVVTEALDSGTYETRFYLYQGSLVEEYALAGSPYTPEKATALAATSSFSFDYQGGLLTVTTDGGTASVALRSETQGRG